MNFHNGQEKLAKALLLPINPSAVIILGLYTITWGLWVANPFWAVFNTAPLYSALLATGIPEWAWGCFAVFCGSVTTYGAVKRKYRPLINGASTAYWHWLMIACFYFAGDWMNTGGITALCFAVYAAFIYVNIRVNFKDNKKSTDILH